MIFKAICLAAAFNAAVAISAHGTTPAPTASIRAPSGVDIYGFIVNTDGGTFDGLAVVRAVRASADLTLVPTHRRPRSARAAQ